jgi:hypothetical protein
MTDEKSDAVAEFEVRPEFSERERVALRYCQEYVSERGRVSDETFAAFRQHFSDEEIVEYSFVASIMASLQWFMESMHIDPKGEQTEFYGGGYWESHALEVPAAAEAGATRANANGDASG